MHASAAMRTAAGLDPEAEGHCTVQKPLLSLAGTGVIIAQEYLGMLAKAAFELKMGGRSAKTIYGLLRDLVVCISDAVVYRRWLVKCEPGVI